jgi:acetyltransferase EpsM
LGDLKSDLVVGTMPNLKEHVSSVTGKSDINCICIPFGFDPVFYSKKPISKDIFSSKFDIPKDKFLVGYAGSLGLTNGLDAIIEASQKMKNDNRFHFIFLGDGDLKQKLINDTKEQKNVLFIPKVKREDVLSFLTLCNLLYFSSLKSKIWKFGWSPNKLIDYMMAEKPILASYSGHKSMIDEADSGFFVPAEDSNALVQILNDIVLMPPLKLQEMGMRGKEWLMNNRSWDVIGNIYLDSLLKLYKKNRDVYLLGIGGHSKVIVEILNLKGYKLQGLYDDNQVTHNQEFCGLKVSGPINFFESGSGVIAIGDNKIRKNINNRLIKVNWETLIHPSAIISKDVEIGEGTVIMAGAIIQPGVKIGKHCIINTGACIDHDCQINDYVHIAPNTSLAGGVYVGEGTLIGIGSSIIPNIKIGQWSKIGAGCIVINDQPDNCTVVGSPAKPIKFHNE